MPLLFCPFCRRADYAPSADPLKYHGAHHMATVAYPTFRFALHSTRPIDGYPMKLEHIGHHILKPRLDLQVAQRECAERLGVTPSGLENWEYGRTTPGDRFMPAVIRFLGYNPMPRPETRGQRITCERVVRGWSRKRLAREAGVDEATIQRMEADVPRLAKGPVRRVFRIFRLSESPLFHCGFGDGLSPLPSPFPDTPPV